MTSRTMNLLIKAHDAFDELGYRPITPVISFDNLFKASLNTLNHTKDFQDGINVADLIQFLFKNFDKVCSKVKKNEYFWKTLAYNGRKLVSVVSDDEAIGTFFITNSIESKYKNVFVSTLNPENVNEPCLFDVSYRKRKFSIGDEDAQYYLSYSFISSKEMNLFDKNKKKICKIVIDDNFDVTLRSNFTNYETITYEGGIGIYEKKYIRSIHGKEPDTKEISAFIEWDILNKKSKFGLSRLELYKNEGDLELFILLAMSCFLLYKSYVDNQSFTYSYFRFPHIFPIIILRRR